MKNLTIIKNENFHNQLGGEKLTAAAIVLLLQLNDKIVYDIVCCENNKQINDRIKEIDNSKIIGLSYIVITEKAQFVEYKRIQIINNK